MIRIETLSVGNLGTNCYLVSQENSDEVLVIDPGGDADKILSVIGERNVAAVLLTHGHFDHTGALYALKDKPIYIHPADQIMLSDAKWSVGWLAGDSAPRPDATHLVQEGDILHLAGLEIAVMHLPGHTLGGVAYRINDVLFTGDTLFYRGYGRTDFPGGDSAVLFASLKRLMMMEENLKVYPGHGQETSLFQERGMI